MVSNKPHFSFLFVHVADPPRIGRPHQEPSVVALDKPVTDPLSSHQEEDGVEKLQLLPDNPLLSTASVQTLNEKTFCCDSSYTAGTNTSKTVKLSVGKKDSVTMLTTVNRTTACSLFHK